MWNTFCDCQAVPHASKVNVTGLLLSAAKRGLTPRSSGSTTAGHQARAGGTRYIFTGPGLASCRCRPLSSNVRPQKSLNDSRPADQFLERPGHMGCRHSNTLRGRCVALLGKKVRTFAPESQRWSSTYHCWRRHPSRGACRDSGCKSRRSCGYNQFNRMESR